MSSEHKFTLERHTYGWIIRAPSGQRGVPALTLHQCGKLFAKQAQLDCGICHHLNATNPDVPPAIFVIVDDPNASIQWRIEVAEKLRGLGPMSRWWLSTDVGLSSAAIFSVLCPNRALSFKAWEYAHGETPKDSSDFERCLNLLKCMPEWASRLNEVAEAHLTTAWPKIIARWEELKAAEPNRRNAILTECHQ